MTHAAAYSEVTRLTGENEKLRAEVQRLQGELRTATERACEAEHAAEMLRAYLARVEAARAALEDELATCCLCEYEFEGDQAVEQPDRRRNVVCGKCWPAKAEAR